MSDLILELVSKVTEVAILEDEGDFYLMRMP